jgi:hypothetical protein
MTLYKYLMHLTGQAGEDGFPLPDQVEDKLRGNDILR